MEYVLVIVGGSLKGRSIALTDEVCSIGRDAGNTIHIPEHSASRKHCAIRRQSAEIFLLADLGSRNGTLRNGSPVRECILNPGDEIQAGDSKFLFLSREQEQQDAAAIQFDDRETLTETILTMRVDPEETIYLKVGPNEGEAAGDALSKGVTLLWQLGSNMRFRSGLQKLAEQLLHSLRECVPDAYSAVVLFENESQEPSWVYSDSAETCVPFPRSIIQKAMAERAAVLSNRLDGLQRSLLIAPLVAGNQTIGILGLSHMAAGVAFDRTDLQLAAAVGAFAGPLFLEARRIDKLEAENRRLQREIDIRHEMIGESPRTLELYRFIAKAARTDSTVLICGESGTGKELAARALHRNSARAAKPFVAINCAALTESLVESELFGHEKGAFTGAFALKKGKLEVANGGTFFLDEVGELPLSVQAKLLRVLQERIFERVGGTRTLQADIRLIAATNRDLPELIGRGAFRQDLYYRLNVITLKMPSLRDRPGDIPDLAQYFVRKHSAIVKRLVRGVSPSAHELLRSYSWPGNIRELENVIERAVAIGVECEVMPEDLPQEVLDAAGEAKQAAGGFHDAVRRAKRELILDAVSRSQGNYTEAAQLLQLNPTYLHRLIGNLDLRAEIRRQFSAETSQSNAE